jgi:hypothetical protein
MVDTISVPSRQNILCALNCSLTVKRANATAIANRSRELISRARSKVMGLVCQRYVAGMCQPRPNKRAAHASEGRPKYPNRIASWKKRSELVTAIRKGKGPLGGGPSWTGLISRSWAASPGQSPQCHRRDWAVKRRSSRQAFVEGQEHSSSAVDQLASSWAAAWLKRRGVRLSRMRCAPKPLR